jgi:2-oxo-3-hexenedioate decarboxylase
MIDPAALARELADAAANRQIVAAPSSRDTGFDLDAAYAAGDALTRIRRAAGHHTVGVKVGFANKAVWRALKLETLVWGPMYDDTVHDAPTGRATLSIGRMIAPKIEPEIVVKLRDAPGDTALQPDDAAAVLRQVEWLAIGFEIIDCPFPDWKFQPVDFVAAFGLHAALVVGPHRRIAAADISSLAAELAAFKVRLFKGDQLSAEGSGRNSLRSPALCVGELAASMARRGSTDLLMPGALVSTGTLTESRLMTAGDVWRVEVDGIALEPLTLEVNG